MSYVRLLLILSIFALTACQDVSDDLKPSNNDQRPEVEVGSSGSQPNQTAPDFTSNDTQSNAVTLSDELALNDAVVLYFTMWCPICDSHMGHIRSHIIPNYPNVRILVIDYVTGSISASRSAQLSNGYTNLTVLVDDDHFLYDTYNGGMGITVVIDNDGTVLMNEDYKNGTKLQSILDSLP